MNSLGMSNDEIREALNNAETKIADALDTINKIVRAFPLTDYERHNCLSLDLFGATSRFICGGRGCEPAFTNGATLEDIKDTIEGYLEDEDSDEFDDEFDDEDE